MTSKEVAEKTGQSYSLVVRWAKKNKLKQIGLDGKFTYVWGEEDFQKFLNRSTKRGRPWPKPNEKE